MAGKLVKRTLDIIKSGVDEKVKDYTSNWTQFTSDAREVKDILIKGETNAADTVQKLKRTGITKKISEWFYGAETEFDASGSDSDFDPGFSVESSSDGKLDGDKSSSALTYDSMKDLSAKQTGMMVKIGRRQTEQSVANTAEVISTINNRTAEMVAVMNNINTSLKGVNDRLDKLIKIQSLGIEAEEERALGGEGGIYDSNGMLSLKGVFDAARTTGSGKFGEALQALGMAKGQISPEMLFGLALDSVLGRQRSSLGGKSVNELGKEFNEFIGNGIQTALTNVITGKAFKSLFGDITSFEADKNYGDLRNARYDTKRAQFDNMTRHSIVKIMPELLIKLNENLSGKSYHINQNGDIVEGPAKNYFREAVNGAIGSANITSRAYSNINQGMKQVFNKEIPKEDIDAAADALLRYYVDYGHRKGSIITKDDIRNASPEAIGTVCDIIGMTNTDSSKGYNYWSKVCQTILYKVTNGNSFDAHAFINSINQSIRNTQSAAAEQARGFYGDQAGKITLDMLKTGYVEKYGSEAQKNQISRSTTTTASKFTTADYVKGIFALLNRGINVKLEGKGTYRKLTEADVKKEPWVIQSTNDEAAARLFGALTGDKNAIKGSMESALGLLGAANDATGGKVGILQTAANLTTMFNQGRGFFDNIRNRQATQSLIAALHGDAGALQAQVYDKLDQAKGAIIRNAPGMAYDQRVQNAGRSIQGIGSNMATHATNLVHSLKNKIMGTDIGKNAYRNVNNAVYANDTRKLNAAQAAIDNFNFHDLSQDDLKILAEYQQAMDAKEFEKAYRLKQGLSSSGSDIIGNLSEDEKKASQNAFRHLSHQYDTINSINARRTNVQGNPDIGAIRMAAPDKASKEHSKMYNLVKGGFNITAKALGAIAKIVRSGFEDVYYGFGSAIQGMFGGLRRNQQTGKMELHRGLIGDLTWGTMKTGAHYTKMALGAAGKLIGKVGSAIGTATQGLRDKWNDGDSGIYDSELDRNLTRAELNERRRDEIVSQNYEHRDKDGKWHFRAQRDENGNKVVKQGSTVTRGDFADAPLKSLGKTVMNVVGKLGAFGKGLVEVTKKLGGMIAKPFKFAADLFKKSSFGKGFFEGFGKAKEARNARKLEKERNSSFANSAIGTVMDVLTGKTKDGPLQAICDILKVIETNTNPNKPTTDPNATGGSADTNEIQSGGTSGGNVDTKGENKENKDDSSDKGEGESSGEEKKKGRWASFKESASEKVGGAVNKFKGTEAGKLVTGTLENMGKVVGGMAQGVMGILKIAMGVLTAMEGFKAIQTLVEDIFKKGLKPLNQVFQKVYHMIKPLATQLTNIVKEIAKALTQMLDGVLKTLTPLLKMISDAISTIFETVLQPVMEILDATLSACMVPITLCLDAMKPALDIICNDLKIVSGVVQMGMGGIMGLLGGIGKGIGFLVSGVGHILKKFSRSAGKKLVNTGKDVSEAADNMLENAKSLMVNGAKQFKEGLAGQLTVVKKLVTLEYLDNEEEEKKETVIDEERAGKINLSDAGANFGSGDVNNYNTWNYTYGSGNTMNQHTYGPTMNMAERGCGPVALADAYMRRTGSGMNPLTLAGAMMGNGSYEPNRGTSVASMVNTGRALGMNMQVGGVTQRSLNGASPSNPITIMGSGSGFGTKRGNDHYLNVVGSDGRGNSYVSNPLNGRVSKTPTSQLALNSRLGLYGSGDKLPDEFGIDLDSMTALERLQSLSDRFQKIFTGDSTVDKTKKEIEAGKSANMANTLDAQLGDITKEELKKLREKAKDEYFDKHKFRAKRDGETDEEYEAALNAEFDKNGVDYFNEYKKNYIYARSEEYKKSADANDFESSWDKMNKNYDKAKETIGDNSLSDDIESEGGSSSSSGGNGTFTSENGVPLFNYGTPKYTDINMHDYIDAGTHKSGHSPLHDFFSQTNDGVVAWSYDGNWFKQRYIPDEVGQGTDGTPNHGGIDINWGGQESLGKKALATTGGTVIAAVGNAKEGDRKANNGCGNNVQWIDSDGKIHWYMHLRDNPEVKKDDKIEAGQLLGYVGNTGDSDGAHLHYTITTDNTSSSDLIGEINPITYFAHFNSSSQMVGDNILEHMWSYLRMQGYTPEAIAGYLGFIKGESAHRTEALHGDWNWNNNQTARDLGTKMREGNKEYLENVEEYIRAVYGSDNSNLNDSNGQPYVDMGLAQWVGEGGAKLIRDTDAANVSWTNEEMQIKHLDWWLSGIKDKLNNAKSLEDAFHIGGCHNAHPSSLTWTTSDEANFGERLNWAKEIYNKYRNADISTWTGYQDAHTKTNTLPDSLSRSEGAINGKDGKTHDIRIKKYRQDYYVALYQDSISQNIVGPNADENRSHTYFVTHLNAALGPFLSSDTADLVTNDIVLQYVEKFHADPSIKDGASQTAYYNNLVKTYKGKFGASPYMWAAVVSSTWRFSDEYGEYDGGSDEASYNMKRTGTVQTESDNLNFRTEPNLTAGLVNGNLTIPSGTALNIEDAGVDGWYKTTYAGKTGYVSSDYIKTTADAVVDPADYQVNLYSTLSNYDNWKNDTIFDDSTTQKNMRSSKGTQSQSIGLSYNTNQILDFFTSKNSKDPHVSELFMIKPDIQNALPFKKLANLWNSESKYNRDYNYDGWIGFPDDRYPLLSTVDKATKYGIYNKGKDLSNTLYNPTFDESDPFYKAWGNKDKYADDNAREVVDRMLNWIAYDGGGIGNPINSVTFNSPELYDIHGNEYAKSRSITYKKGDDGKWNMKPDSSTTVYHAAGATPVFHAAGVLPSGSGDVSPEVPAVDMNKLFDETSQTMQNATNAFTGGTTVVVTRDDQSTADMITRLSEITFKVRNERVEELLEELVDYVKTTKKKSSTFNHVHGSNNYTVEDMFDDEIPEGVVRLSKGG